MTGLWRARKIDEIMNKYSASPNNGGDGSIDGDGDGFSLLQERLFGTVTKIQSISLTVPLVWDHLSMILCLQEIILIFTVRFQCLRLQLEQIGS